MTTLSKNSKNAEIQAVLGNVKSPTVFATAQSSNPDYVTIYMVQEREKAFDKTNIKNLLLSASSQTRFVRHIEQAHKNQVDTMGIKPGFKFEGWNVSLIDTTEIPYPGAEPKRRGAEGDVITHEGAAVYEVTALTHGEESQDVKLAYDAVEETVSTKAEAPAEFAGKS